MYTGDSKEIYLNKICIRNPTHARHACLYDAGHAPQHLCELGSSHLNSMCLGSGLFGFK